MLNPSDFSLLIGYPSHLDSDSEVIRWRIEHTVYGQGTYRVNRLKLFLNARGHWSIDFPFGTVLVVKEKAL